MTAQPCPVCGKPAAPDLLPFCSRGCANRDLLQWLGEGYRLPVKDDAHDGLDSGESAD
ncbi:MAG: DNA gyrase inhibitor YacG [Sphingomonas sp.]